MIYPSVLGGTNEEIRSRLYVKANGSFCACTSHHIYQCHNKIELIERISECMNLYKPFMNFEVDGRIKAYWQYIENYDVVGFIRYWKRINRKYFFKYRVKNIVVKFISIFNI